MHTRANRIRKIITLFLDRATEQSQFIDMPKVAVYNMQQCCKLIFLFTVSIQQTVFIRQNQKMISVHKVLLERGTSER